jgi:hypothetical protein
MALFDTSKELKSINSAFAISFELDNIQSFLDDAERQYLLPRLGQETLSELLETKKAGLDSKSPQKKLLHLAQKAVLGFAFGEYSAFGALQIQDAGISVLSRDNFRPASDSKLVELRKQCIRAGFEALEAMITFLEHHLAIFGAYAASSERKQNRASFICSAAEFSKACVAIHPSVFPQLQSELVKAESDTICPLIGAACFEQLKKAHQERAYTQDQQRLIEQIQRTIAPAVLAEMICYNGLVIDPNGCFQNNVGEPLGQMAENRLQTALLKLTRKAQIELSRLQKMIKSPLAEVATGQSNKTHPYQVSKMNIYWI